MRTNELSTQRDLEIERRKDPTEYFHTTWIRKGQVEKGEELQKRLRRCQSVRRKTRSEVVSQSHGRRMFPERHGQ